MENEILEQPESKTINPSFEQSNEINVVQNEKALGSQLLGKFKNVESLMDAYSNLQAEFTRKSQALRELEKRDNLSNSVVKNTTMQSDNTNTMQTQNVADTRQVLENNQNDKPVFNNSLWQSQVSEFLAQNPAAKSFASEISALLISDKVLASLPDSLNIAYAKVLAKNYKSQQELVNDENFINNYILTSETIKQKIIKDYLNTITKQKAPQLIANATGSHIGLTPQDKPKSLAEANKIVEQMLKNK